MWLFSAILALHASNSYGMYWNFLLFISYLFIFFFFFFFFFVNNPKIFDQFELPNCAIDQFTSVFSHSSIFSVFLDFKLTNFVIFTRLRSRREVMCLVVVYVRSFVGSFLPSLIYNCEYLTYFDRTWNIKRRKYREESSLYYIEWQPRANF